MQIRPAKRHDHDAVCALWDAAGLGKTAADEWTALIDGPNSAILIAEDGGDVIGAVVATYDGWRAYIYHAVVDPWRRREGIGHALLREAEMYLTEAGARFVFTMVDGRNEDGVALLGGSGYVADADVVLAKRLAMRVAL